VQVPLLVHVAAAADAAPLVAAAALRRPVRGARAWLLAWCGVVATSDGLSLYLALHHTPNMWLAYVFTPLSTALVLWAISCWQARELSRLALRFAIVAVLVAWAVLTAAFENTSTFSRAAEPMANLVCLGAAAYTLVVRSHSASAPLLKQDWFWISAGLALYFATWSAVGPLSALLVASTPQLMPRVYDVQSALEIAAMLAITRGVMCPAAT
jgi:hypothetical protein